MSRQTLSAVASWLTTLVLFGIVARDAWLEYRMPPPCACTSGPPPLPFACYAPPPGDRCSVVVGTITNDAERP